ncbi:MAG: hypothetical protein ACRDV9_13475 [Acidimicrobiia bacterium]
MDQEITPPTPEEEAKIQECLAAAGVTVGPGARSATGPPAAGQVGPVDGGGGGGGGRGFGGAFRQCLPDRLQRFQGSVTNPQRTLRQVLNPPRRT